MSGSNSLITIDGSAGEGGGQVLRTSLALSLLTGTPFRLENIRARRKRPGLGRQHLTCVRAACEVGGGASGAELGSRTLEFWPAPVRTGDYRFAIGTAGSTTLVLQTVLPPLLAADGPSTVRVEGGTYNPLAPPFDFLARTWAPLVARLGPRVEIVQERAGFYPAGGGRLRATVEPAPRPWSRLELLEAGEVKRRRVRALLANLRDSIGDREVAAFVESAGWRSREATVERVEAHGPGNVLLAEIEREHVHLVLSECGERGRLSEDVGRALAGQVRTVLDADVPVDEHLADQLLLVLAIGGGGTFRSVAPSLHATTNAAIIRRFLDVAIDWREDARGTYTFTVDETRDEP